MTHPIIIIGAGLAGWTTAREFRKLDPIAPLMLITADSGDFYAKPSLSNALAQKRSPAQLVSTAAAKMADTLQLSLLARTRVLAIDAVAQRIRTSQGEFSYSQLVLATGAQPIRVPVAGDAADQVQSINSLDDFSDFHARLTGGRHQYVLIMGAGLIGCEFANDLIACGYQVSVVDPSAGPMGALLPPQAGVQLREALAALGVRWHWGATVQSVSHHVTQGEGAEPRLQVELSNGQVVAADRVLSAIGLRADTVLAQASGLVCERAVVVDARLQTSAPHIYALGDGAQYAAGLWGEAEALVSGGRTMPYVMPIMSAARALAATLAGTPTEVVFPLMPVAIKTPALPIVVAAPAPGTLGEWRGVEPGIWQFIDARQQMRGFVITGRQTTRRAEQAKLLAA
ncbi:MAG: FAD-dependent oxidoreductase [Pseudomonadota bacterium]